MKKLFLKEVSQKELDTRKNLLTFIQIMLWVGLLFIVFYLGYNGFSSRGIIILIAVGLTAFRYEFWVLPFQEADTSQQRKFFTNKKHNAGEKNPLW